MTSGFGSPPNLVKSRATPCSYFVSTDQLFGLITRGLLRRRQLRATSDSSVLRGQKPRRCAMGRGPTTRASGSRRSCHLSHPVAGCSDSSRPRKVPLPQAVRHPGGHIPASWRPCCAALASGHTWRDAKSHPVLPAHPVPRPSGHYGRPVCNSVELIHDSGEGGMRQELRVTRGTQQTIVEFQLPRQRGTGLDSSQKAVGKSARGFHTIREYCSTSCCHWVGRSGCRRSSRRSS